MPITNKEMKDAIEIVVRTNYAIKNVDLALKVISKLHPTLFESKQYYLVLNEMVANKDIIELDYSTPDMEYRIKSIYFTKGTKFSLISLNSLKENV